MKEACTAREAGHASVFREEDWRLLRRVLESLCTRPSRLTLLLGNRRPSGDRLGSGGLVGSQARAEA